MPILQDDLGSTAKPALSTHSGGAVIEAGIRQV